MRRFDTWVTFQEAVPGRTPAGQVVATEYENVAGLTDLPARIVPATEEKAGERMVTIEDLFEIYVAGNQAIRPDMVCLAEEAVYDIKRVATPTQMAPAVLATIVLAQRVSL